MQIAQYVLNASLDAHFNDSGKTYTLKLRYSTGTESSGNTINFSAASGGSVSMSGTTYFAVSSGVTVSGIRVYDSESTMYIDETLDVAKTYTANGTFTVSGLTVTIGV